MPETERSISELEAKVQYIEAAETFQDKVRSANIYSWMGLFETLDTFNAPSSIIYLLGEDQTLDTMDIIPIWDNLYHAFTQYTGSKNLYLYFVRGIFSPNLIPEFTEEIRKEFGGEPRLTYQDTFSSLSSIELIVRELIEVLPEIQVTRPIHQAVQEFLDEVSPQNKKGAYII